MAELPIYRATIEPDWIDYNGHLRDAYYGLVASYAIDDVMDHLGLDAEYRKRTRCTLFTLELHIHYLHEVRSTDNLIVRTSVLDFDRKRLQVGCRFIGERQSDAVATAELMLLHVHQGENPSSIPFPAEVEQRLATLKIAAAEQQAFAPRSRKIELKRV